MAFSVKNTYGHTLNIIDSEVGLVTKTRTGTQSMAKDEEGRKVIKSGTLYNDNGDLGIVFDDYDVTDGDCPIAVIKAGRVRKDRVPATVTAKEADLKGIGIYLV